MISWLIFKIGLRTAIWLKKNQQKITEIRKFMFPYLAPFLLYEPPELAIFDEKSFKVKSLYGMHSKFLVTSKRNYICQD